MIKHPADSLLRALLKRSRMFWLVNIRYRLLGIGPGTYIGPNVRIRPHSVLIGALSYVGPECWFASKVTIGNFVLVGPRVAIVGGDHKFTSPGIPLFVERGENREVFIEDDVWVGYASIIMHGVRIGEGSIIAAGSVITDDVKPYTIVGGVPAKPLGERFSSQDDIEQHQTALLNKLLTFGLQRYY